MQMAQKGVDSYVLTQLRFIWRKCLMCKKPLLIEFALYALVSMGRFEALLQKVHSCLLAMILSSFSDNF